MFTDFLSDVFVPLFFLGICHISFLGIFHCCLCISDAFVFLIGSCLLSLLHFAALLICHPQLCLADQARLMSSVDIRVLASISLPHHSPNKTTGFLQPSALGLQRHRAVPGLSQSWDLSSGLCSCALCCKCFTHGPAPAPLYAFQILFLPPRSLEFILRFTLQNTVSPCCPAFVEVHKGCFCPSNLLPPLGQFLRLVTFASWPF